jgi:hypothetical protein
VKARVESELDGQEKIVVNQLGEVDAFLPRVLDQPVVHPRIADRLGRQVEVGGHGDAPSH